MRKEKFKKNLNFISRDLSFSNLNKYKHSLISMVISPEKTLHYQMASYCSFPLLYEKIAWLVDESRKSLFSLTTAEVFKGHPR